MDLIIEDLITPLLELVLLLVDENEKEKEKQ